MRCSPHAVLEDDAESNTCLATKGNETVCFLRIASDGLLHQDVLAGFRQFPDDINTGIWRCCDDGEIDIRIARRLLD